MLGVRELLEMLLQFGVNTGELHVVLCSQLGASAIDNDRQCLAGHKPSQLSSTESVELNGPVKNSMTRYTSCRVPILSSVPSLTRPSSELPVLASQRPLRVGPGESAWKNKWKNKQSLRTSPINSRWGSFLCLHCR